MITNMFSVLYQEKSMKGLKSLPKKETLRKIVISWQ